jgi:hypothetical protein
VLARRCGRKLVELRLLLPMPPKPHSPHPPINSIYDDYEIYIDDDYEVYIYDDYVSGGGFSGVVGCNPEVSAHYVADTVGHIHIHRGLVPNLRRPESGQAGSS